MYHIGQLQTTAFGFGLDLMGLVQHCVWARELDYDSTPQPKKKKSNPDGAYDSIQSQCPACSQCGKFAGFPTLLQKNPQKPLFILIPKNSLFQKKKKKSKKRYAYYSSLIWLGKLVWFMNVRIIFDQSIFVRLYVI